MNRPVLRRRITRRRNIAEALETRALLATITVTSATDVTADDGQVTLREAIEAANTDTSVDGSTAGSGADTIVFAPALDGQIITMLSEVPIEESLSIQGSGTGKTHIRATRQTRLFQVRSALTDVHVSVSDLRITHTKTAIQHMAQSGSLTVRHARIRNNRQGIVTRVDLTVGISEFFENKSGNRGAAIEVAPNTQRTVTINRSRFIDNETRGRRDESGGAVFVGTSDLTINASLFSGNSTTEFRGHGGALYAQSSNVTIRNSTFTGNESYASGGAIYLWQSDAVIESSTIVDNQTRFTNTNSGLGGGVRFLAPIRDADLDLMNTVVAGNTLGGGSIDEDIHATDANVTASHSFVGSNRASTLTANGGTADADGNLIGTDVAPLDPDLGPLQDNGGPTDSMLPNGTSTLLEAGGESTLATDQRGEPRLGGDAVDIGATEFSDVAFQITPSRPVISEGDQSLTVTFDLTLQTDVGQAFDVTVQSRDESAEAGTDFNAVNQDVSFAGNLGETQQFSVTIIDDNMLELRETFGFDFSVSLANQVAAFNPTRVLIDSDDTSGIGRSGSTLLIYGDNANDTVTITPDGANIVGNLNGTSQSFPAAEIDQAVVLLREGDNSLTVDAALTLDVHVTSGEGSDTVTTAGGDDRVHTAGGDDTIDTGPGADDVFGGVGSDVISGGTGPDTLNGGHDNDSIEGGNGNDLLIGRQGHDTMHGNGGGDTLLGGGSSDSLTGGDGNDRIFGLTDPAIDDAPGNDRGDRIEGGAGNDQIFGGTGRDNIDGGDDNDTISTDGSGVIRGGLGNDQLTANGNAGVRMIGDEGNDTMTGNAGDDTMLGNAGRDLMFGRGGNDHQNGGIGQDLIRGEAGDDILIGGEGRDSLQGGDGNDSISGGNGPDNLNGNDGDDSVSGDEGEDVLRGEDGHDLLIGGTDDDTFFGANGNDVLIGGFGSDNMRGDEDTDVMIPGTTNLDSAALALVMAEWSSGRDVLVRRANLLDGSGSNDRDNGSAFLISAAGASQTVFDDNVADIVTGGAGRDWVFVNFDQDESDSDLF